MSFLKITDPAKRDFIVQEYLETKDNVRKNYITERTGELGAQIELTKFFKPVIESQKTVAKDLLSRRCDFDRDSASSLSAQKLPYVEPHKF